MKKYYVIKEMEGSTFGPRVIETFIHLGDAMQYADVMNRTSKLYKYRILTEVLTGNISESERLELECASKLYTLLNVEGTRQSPPAPRQTNHAYITLEETEKGSIHFNR